MGHAAFRPSEGRPKGNQHVFEVQVYLNGLDPKAVRVELYAAGVMGSASVRQEMKRALQVPLEEAHILWQR
jgi:starch phosphorylase